MGITLHNLPLTNFVFSWTMSILISASCSSLKARISDQRKPCFCIIIVNNYFNKKYLPFLMIILFWCYYIAFIYLFTSLNEYFLVDLHHINTRCLGKCGTSMLRHSQECSSQEWLIKFEYFVIFIVLWLYLILDFYFVNVDKHRKQQFKELTAFLVLQSLITLYLTFSKFNVRITVAVLKKVT